MKPNKRAIRKKKQNENKLWWNCKRQSYNKGGLLESIKLVELTCAEEAVKGRTWWHEKSSQ